MYTERVLLISGTEKGVDAVTSFLKTCGYGSVSAVCSGDEARRLLQQDLFHLVVINTPLKDEFGYQLSLQLTQSTAAGVILICKADLMQEMTNRTLSQGVLVVAKPLNRAAFQQSVSLARAMHNRIRSIKLENEKLQKKMEELRYISRAKCMLMEKNACTTEMQAHRYIEKTAMDTRRTRKEIAMEILSGQFPETLPEL